MLLMIVLSSWGEKKKQNTLTISIWNRFFQGEVYWVTIMMLLAGKMPQQLPMNATLTEHQSLIAHIHIVTHHCM